MTHLSAEFIGVPAEQLRDSALLGGLLIAAAGAAGMSAAGRPEVRATPDGGISAATVADGAHIAIHSLPDAELLLFDGLGPPSHDFRKAVEVFSRRLSARDVRTALRHRG